MPRAGYCRPAQVSPIAWQSPSGEGADDGSTSVNGVEEIYTQGDAFYIPPGHTPSGTAGAEIVQFSPAKELRTTVETMMKNMSAMKR